MLETHLRSPVTRRRLRSGPAADYVDHFADRLDSQGNRPRSIEDVLRALAGWTDWMGATGFTATTCFPPSALAKRRSRRTARALSAWNPWRVADGRVGVRRISPSTRGRTTACDIARSE